MYSIDYLLEGSDLQQAVHHVLTESIILEKLEKYNPIFVGSIPIAVYLPDSDIDIICCYQDKKEFSNFIVTSFEMLEGFKKKEFNCNGNETVIANFKIAGFQFEIFGQNIPTHLQLGYQHMKIEEQLLAKYGDALRRYVVNEKMQGVKTEPAFCKWLGIEGNPYLEILKLENLDLK